MKSTNIQIKDKKQQDRISPRARYARADMLLKGECTLQPEYQLRKIYFAKQYFHKGWNLQLQITCTLRIRGGKDQKQEVWIVYIRAIKDMYEPQKFS